MKKWSFEYFSDDTIRKAWEKPKWSTKPRRLHWLVVYVVRLSVKYLTQLWSYFDGVEQEKKVVANVFGYLRTKNGRIPKHYPRRYLDQLCRLAAHQDESRTLLWTHEINNKTEYRSDTSSMLPTAIESWDYHQHLLSFIHPLRFITSKNKSTDVTAYVHTLSKKGKQYYCITAGGWIRHDHLQWSLIHSTSYSSTIKCPQYWATFTPMNISLVMLYVLTSSS